MAEVEGIVVHFGPWDLLATCLRALVPQVDRCVVVNHNPEPIPQDLRRQFADAVLWDEPGLNGGFSRGVNRALSFTRAPLVVVVNPDTVLMPGSVEALRSFMERNPRLGLAGPRLSHPDGTLQTSSYRLPTLVQLAGHLLGIAGKVPPWLKRALAQTPLRHTFGQLDPHTQERMVEMVSGACFMARRQALLDVGPLDPNFFLYYEEKDLCKRLSEGGWLVGFTPTARAIHHIGGSAPSRTATAHRHRALGALRYFGRHGSPLQRAGARVMLGLHALVHLWGPGRHHHRAVLAACLSRTLPCDSC